MNKIAQTIDRLQGMLAESDRRIADLRASNDDLKSEIGALTEKLSQRNTIISDLQTKLNTRLPPVQNEGLAIARAEIGALQKKLAETEARLLATKAKAKPGPAQKAAPSRRIVDRGAEVAKLGKRVAELEAQLRAANERQSPGPKARPPRQIVDRGAEVTKLEKKVAELEAQLRVANDRPERVVTRDRLVHPE